MQGFEVFLSHTGFVKGQAEVLFWANKLIFLGNAWCIVQDYDKFYNTVFAMMA
jgi:hypothetical protein